MTLVQVETVEEGDVLVTTGGKEVEVERVDVYDDPVYPNTDAYREYVVRWRAGSELGSFRPMQEGDTVVRVARRLKVA